MTSAEALAVYSGAILAGSVAGGALPLLGSMGRSDALLAFSAGVMLGAAGLHMLPEAFEGLGAGALPAVAAGFLALYLLERFVLVHVCVMQPPTAGAAGAAHAHGEHPHAHGAACDEHGPGHAPHADGGSAAPTARAGRHRQHHDHVHTLGLSAFAGLSLHTLVDGFALGAASGERALGLLVFVAILLHKVPNSFSLSAILRAEGWSRGHALAMNATFGAMVPLGAGLYLVLRRWVDAPSFAAYALAASAGTFLHLALSDIVPDLARRGGPRLRLAAWLGAGAALMAALRLVAHD